MDETTEVQPGYGQVRYGQDPYFVKGEQIEHYGWIGVGVGFSIVTAGVIGVLIGRWMRKKDPFWSWD